MHEARAFVLHRRPFRDSSQIVDIFAADHGRLAVVARGVKSAGRRSKTALQPFQPLLMSWTARSELGTLSGAEPAGPPVVLSGDGLHAGFYVNELIMKLTTRLDPQPQVFELYRSVLATLATGVELAPPLRWFELRLLAELGYGLELTSDGMDGSTLAAERYYRVVPDNRPMPVSGPSAHDLVFRGDELLAVATGAFEREEICRIAQRITRAAIDRCLDGRALNTRKVLAAIHARRSPEGQTK